MKAKVSDAFSFMVIIETKHGKSHLKCNDPTEAKEIVSVINGYQDIRNTTVDEAIKAIDSLGYTRYDNFDYVQITEAIERLRK